MPPPRNATRPPTLALTAAVLFALAGPAEPLRAQDADAPRDRGREETLVQEGDGGAAFHASPYLPLDHWAYPLLDRWLVDGRATELSPLVRPYRRMDVARVVRRLRAERARELPGWESRWLGRLGGELAPELAVLDGREEADHELRATVQAGGTWRSQTHRDPLRPALEGPFARDRFLERVSARAHARAGPLVAGFHGARDGIYRHDAQFPAGRVIPDQNFPVLDEFGYRTEEGYLEVQSRYAALGFGRAYRNWGVPRLPGFLRSDYAYSEEEVSYRVGTDRIFLTGLFAVPPDAGPDTARYFSAHRLEVRPWESLSLAVTEAVIWGGPGASLDLGLLNPLSFWHAVRGTEDPPRNEVGQVDVWWRPVRGVALLGSLVVDGTNSPRTSQACCAMGGALGFDLTRLGGGWALRGRWTAIQSLVYRTGQSWERWSLYGLGLGWDKSDLHLATLEADWLRVDGLLLRPRVDVQLLGEGDFREPHPPVDRLNDFPRILVGTAETTLRASVAGRWRPSGSPLDLEWDLGVSRIWDAGHREGDDRTVAVGRLRVLVEAPLFRASLTP